MVRALAKLLPGVLLLLACTQRPSASAERGEHEADQPADGGKLDPKDAPESGRQPEPLPPSVLEAPIPSEAPPLEFWTAGEAACEPGTQLSGAAPPQGTEIRCVDEQGRWTGMEARFHPNGKLQSIGRRHQSRPLGVWLFFHPSGTKAAEHTYVDGQLHGTLRRYAENGQEIEYGEYRGGRPWGLFIHRDEQGQELSRAQLEHGTGLLRRASLEGRSESDYVHGLLHGSRRVFDDRGRKLEESSWSGGEQHGPELRWDADGHKLFEGHWQRGKQQGEFIRFAAQTPEQIIERSIWHAGEQLARQLYREGAPLAELPPASECDSDAGLSAYLERARGRGLPDSHACVTRTPLFPGVIMLGNFAYDRGCMGAEFVVDCKLVESPPSAAELLARAGWAKASAEQRIELAKEFVGRFALGYEATLSHEPEEPQWRALDDGGVEGVIWVAKPAGMRPESDKDQLRFRFADDGSLTRELLQQLNERAG